jgi:hypothetical protein
VNNAKRPNGQPRILPALDVSEPLGSDHAALWRTFNVATTTWRAPPATLGNGQCAAARTGTFFAPQRLHDSIEMREPNDANDTAAGSVTQRMCHVCVALLDENVINGWRLHFEVLPHSAHVVGLQQVGRHLLYTFPSCRVIDAHVRKRANIRSFAGQHAVTSQAYELSIRCFEARHRNLNVPISQHDRRVEPTRLFDGGDKLQRQDLTRVRS